MNTAAAHYDTHLGPVYAWMLGNLQAAQARSSAELEDMGLPSLPNLKALDLGAGLGLHTLALAKRGFSVTAIDSCAILLDELRAQAAGLPISIVQGDLLEFRTHAPDPCDVIICMGDTLTHLPSFAAVDSLLSSVAAALSQQGVFAATFRDYASRTLTGNDRCILVKRDESRILTCFLEYEADHVTVHDLLTQREDDRWVRRESTYPKLRLAPDRVLASLEALGLSARRETAPSGMVRIVARTRTTRPPPNLCPLDNEHSNMKHTMRHCVSILLTMCVAHAAFGQTGIAKKIITHESLWMMKRVGAPVVSPDGKWVVYPVNEPSYEKDKAVSDLWLVATDGQKPPRRITNTKAAEEDVAWSPDSTHIAFATKREGDEISQIYVLNLAEGGEARRLTNVSTGAESPRWRPDGKAILFESRVYPGALDDAANKKIAAERKDRKYNVRAYEHFPVRFWNEWLDDRQPTLMVQNLDQDSAKDILSGTALAHQSGFSGTETDSSVTLAPVWSPDGREIVFIATTERWNAAFAQVGYHLYRVSADGTSEPQIVTPQAGEYDDAKFSADGRSLYFKFAAHDAEIYHLQHLYKAAWPAAGDARLVTRDFDREASRYALTPDGKSAYLLVAEAGKENLYRVATDGGKPVLIVEPASGGYTALEIAQKSTKLMLVGSYGSSISPSEVVRIDPAQHMHVNLTHVDVAAAAAIDWQVPQHFYFTSSKGRNIHNMLVLPPAFDSAKKYPLLVLIHGGPASNNPDQIGLRWNYHLLAAPGYVVLMTDYTGSTSFGEKFAQAIKLDPLKTPGDEIDQAVDETIRRYPFVDAGKMCAAGASYGGHLANWIEATTTRYKCIVSHAGEVDLTTQWGISDGIYGREVMNGGPPWEGSPIWRDQSPITYAAKWKTPMLLSIGERDYRVPLGNTLENWSTLQRMHVPSRLLVWPDAWHWILKPEDSRHFYEEVHRWLGIYLKDEKANAGGNAELAAQ